MSKGTKKKRKKAGKGGRRKDSRFSSLNISSIEQHKRAGSKLVPPLAQIPNMTTSSWSDHHMPEMLWAVLLAGVLERRHYLDVLRKVAVQCRSWFLREDDESVEEQSPDPEVGLNFSIIVDQTKLAEVSDEEFRDFIKIPLAHPLGYAALRPILLIRDLPGIARWKRYVNAEPAEHDWNTLAHAIANVLDHQSETSTDIRWFKVIVAIISDRMRFPESFAERLEEFRLFPDKGDMRSVRPSIRSMEMCLRRNDPTEWIERFWAQVLRDTVCIDPSEGEGYTFIETGIDPNTLSAARDGVIEKFSRNIRADRVDARLDSAFGLVLYALGILEEIGVHRIHTRIVGAVALRSLAEVSITLHYLSKADSAEMWQSYRVYGAGQAKLAFLKTQQTHGDLPNFIDESTLYSIANEDMWQEFLNIDVGHWASSNLRKLAMDSGTKDIYDQYYDWSSSYIHGNWAAVRDTNFVTCHNPLHRLHRIPRVAHRSLRSVEPDAVKLVNEMIDVLERLFPSDEIIPPVALGKPEAGTTAPNTGRENESSC
ncbi:DUF5677 domain-containing protein [Alloalcanivorax xenomutans]|uniref:DUF5677 domain-containing protein n=1 Tax=Alloalcanivorax xenomutans TaxID=1094342 RepID=UPI0011AB432C|nr:DUF5677 domain-containing protein [Alloalcanivorax xenomutans]MCE7524425.1 DUF5677 domain-containing protein [Alloalcanivorax xenomutans]